MEFVFFVFCDSVVAALGAPSLIEEPLSSRVWQKAFTQHKQNRISATIEIAYEEGIWSYGINCFKHGTSRSLTFEDLQKMNGKYSRISRIHIEQGSESNQSSFEGILKLVKFTVPFVSMCELEIEDVDYFQEDELCRLLSFYRNSAINSLFTIGTLGPICAFMTEILKSDMLKDVWFLCSVPSTFVEEIEEIALMKLFERFIFSPKTFKFTRSFFEKLFARSFDGSFETCRFQSCFDFKVGNLKDFREDLQISASDWLIEWRRVDGVFVTVKNNVSDNRLYVEFALARTHRFF